MIVDEIIQISRDAAIVMAALTNHKFRKILTLVNENYHCLVEPKEYSQGQMHVYKLYCGKYLVIYDVLDEIPRILVVGVR